MKRPRLTMQLNNRPEAVERACAAAAHVLQQGGAAPATRYTAHLVIEELLTNIIKYAHDDQVPHPVKLLLDHDGANWRLTLEDEGRPFDPRNALPPPDGPLEERPIGGLGLHLVREMTDAMLYTREHGQNRVTVVLRREPSTGREDHATQTQDS